MIDANADVNIDKVHFSWTRNGAVTIEVYPVAATTHAGAK